MLRDWFLGLVLEYLKSHLTKDNVEEWADKARQYLLPLMHDWADRLCDMVDAEAAKTDGSIDDAAAKALRMFLDAFLPDNPTTL